MHRKRGPISLAILLASLFFVPYWASAQVTATTALDRRDNTKTCQPFIPATFYLENSNARSVVAGDFNGDGILDLAALTLDTNLAPDLSILLGKKDGTFVPGKTYAIGADGLGFPLAVGDFNGDGKLDVVAATFSAVVVFLGNGDGTFRARKESVVPDVIGIAAGDFNQDGKLDLVVAEFSSVSDVQIMIGKGDGTFEAPVNYAVTSYPTSVVVADFNHDGHLDLAVANGGLGGGNTVSVLFGNGNGTFRQKVDYRVGYEPFGIATADLNGDGNADIVTADYVGGTASVLLNKGDGTFLPATRYVVGHPFAPYRVTTAPLEAGSKPSLAVATIAGTYILANEGNGKFEAAQGYEPVSTSVVLADFDGDGKADLAIAGGYQNEGGSGGVTVIEGHGTFVTPTAYVATPSLASVTVGDFNGDGIPDLAGTGLDGAPLAVLLGQRNGRFSRPVFYENISSHLGEIVSGDFNRDGKLDLAVVTGPTSRRVQILLGNGDGTFTLGQAYEIPGGFLTVADLNGNGILDIVASGGRTVSILLGRGDGTFRFGPSYPGDGPSVVGDFNGDGKPDFAVTNSSNFTVSIYLGHGDGTFNNAANYSVTFPASAITAGDFNGDGKLDLAVGESPRAGSGDMQVFLGNGNGTFATGASFTGVFAPIAADLNGDGKVDLSTVNIQGLLQVLVGNGDGTFAAGNTSSVGQLADSPVLADLTRDGAFDFVVPNLGGGEVSVLLNGCAPDRQRN